MFKEFRKESPASWFSLESSALEFARFYVFLEDD
tara:strand:+ start:340 stop:441 length:102 start_codon:yes stop_codon:yes gene_type:complete